MGKHGWVPCDRKEHFFCEEGLTQGVSHKMNSHPPSASDATTTFSETGERREMPPNAAENATGVQKRYTLC